MHVSTNLGVDLVAVEAADRVNLLLELQAPELIVMRSRSTPSVTDLGHRVLSQVRLVRTTVVDLVGAWRRQQASDRASGVAEFGGRQTQMAVCDQAGVDSWIMPCPERHRGSGLSGICPPMPRSWREPRIQGRPRTGRPSQPGRQERPPSPRRRECAEVPHAAGRVLHRLAATAAARPALRPRRRVPAGST